MQETGKNIGGEKIGRREVIILDKGADGAFVGVYVQGHCSWKASATFRTREKAEAYVQSLRDAEAKAQAARDAKKAELAAAKASFVNPFKVGDLLHYSWGYEQTQCEFAQVVAVGRRSVSIRPIAGRSVRATGWASDIVAPIRDAFLDKPDRQVNLTFSIYDGKLHCWIPAEYGSWTPCGEGKEGFHRSWYA